MSKKKEERKRIVSLVKERAAFIYSSSDISITEAARKACKELNVEFNDTMRRTMSRYMKTIGLTNNVSSEDIEEIDVF